MPGLGSGRYPATPWRPSAAAFKSIAEGLRDDVIKLKKQLAEAQAINRGEVKQVIEDLKCEIVRKENTIHNKDVELAFIRREVEFQKKAKARLMKTINILRKGKK